MTIGFRAALLALLLIAGCGGNRQCASPRSENHAQSTAGPSTTSRSVEVSDQQDWFVDGTQEAGLDFRHFNGMSGKFYLAEIMAPGVALLDYDNDDDLDIYIVQGRMLGATGTVKGAPVGPGQLAHSDRLYRNDLQVHSDGTRTLHFTDVTRA